VIENKDRARSSLGDRDRGCVLGSVRPNAALHGAVSSWIHLPSRCPILMTCGARASPSEAEKDARYA